MENCLTSPAECEYLEQLQEKTTAGKRQQKMKSLVASIAVIVAVVLLASNYVQPSTVVRAHSHHPIARSLGRGTVKLGATRSFRGDDKKVVYAETWDEAEHLTEKRLTQSEIDKRKEAQLYTVDLYTENWDGDVYKGPAWNIMTAIFALGVGIPVLGLIFAYTAYGTLWGVSDFH